MSQNATLKRIMMTHAAITSFFKCETRSAARRRELATNTHNWKITKTKWRLPDYRSTNCPTRVKRERSKRQMHAAKLHLAAAQIRSKVWVRDERKKDESARNVCK
jgi:hypothetical protein